MKKSIIALLFVNLHILLLFGFYEVGDTVSLADQSIEYDVCSGDYDSEQLKLSDFNGEINGAGYMVTLLLIQATW